MNLVFPSGFFVPQRILGLNYFRGLENHIKNGGQHKALFPLVPALGGREKRAAELARQIQQAYPEGDIHIIAHSMGGLDSRTVIAANPNGLTARIKSLTTLSTPHRGSPVADLLAGPKPDGERRAIYEALSHAVAALGIETGALGDLTTDGTAKVPDVASTHGKQIRFRSYFACGRPGFLATSLALAPTHHYIFKVTNQMNDGVVARDSAKYGDFQEPFWPCDHVDMIGHNLDTADLGDFQFNHFSAIDHIIDTL